MGNLAATSHGATIVIPAPVFDPVATLQAVQQEQCTSLYGVPTMFIAELALRDFSSYDLSSLRTGIMAGSPCPVEVMKRVVAEMNMAEVTIMYGMTETSPVSTMTRREDDLERRVSTVGTVMPHVEVQIIDPGSLRTVPTGTPGELCTRGYSVMLGYWDAPEQTAEAVDAAGWMHTGDLATMDEAGYVAIVGRIKDLVIRGGENIYPREIEEFLYSHPSIADVQVVGVPDEKYGEELMAWVKLNAETSLTIDELREFCQGRLAHYKIPRYLHVTDEFPMTVTGKIRKVEMRERAEEISTRPSAPRLAGKAIAESSTSVGAQPSSVRAEGIARLIQAALELMPSVAIVVLGRCEQQSRYPFATALLHRHSVGLRRRRHRHPGERAHSQNPAEPGRHPPVPIAEHRHQRRHQQRTHDRGVEQDAEAERAGEDLQVGAGSGRQREERQEQDQRRAGDQPAGPRDAFDDGRIGVVSDLVLLTDTRQDEHLVIHGQPVEEREDHQRHPEGDRAGGMNAEDGVRTMALLPEQAP